jgi:hypothetical protein
MSKPNVPVITKVSHEKKRGLWSSLGPANPRQFLELSSDKNQMFLPE